MKTDQQTVSVMTVDEIHAATVKLAAFQEQMTFILPLTDAERREHAVVKLGLAQLRMMETRVVAARQNRKLLPPAFDMETFEQNAGLTVALGECLATIDKLRAGVSDTLRAVGRRAVTEAATACAHIKVGSASVDQLKQTVARIAPRRVRALGHAPPASAPNVVSTVGAPASTLVNAPVAPTEKAA